MTVLVAPSMNRPTGVLTSVLRRRKSHRVRQSVVSLPACGDEREASREVEDPSSKTKFEKPTVVGAQVPAFADVLPPALRTSFPSATSNAFVSPATSKPIQSIFSLVRPAFDSSSVSFHSLRNSASTCPLPVVQQARRRPVQLRFVIGSEQGTKMEEGICRDDDKVGMVYDAFANTLERSRIEFRPWSRDHHPGASDEEEEG